MEESELKNPYLHLPMPILLRRYRQTERNIQKIIDGKGNKLDFNLNRMAFLTLSEAIQTRTETEELNNLMNSDSYVTETPPGGLLP